MKQYFRIMLGKKSAHAAECFEGGFVGADFGIDQDLTQHLPEDWRSFNKQWVPAYLARFPDKTRIGAGLACGMLWTICRGVRPGDVVLAPDGSGNYRVGEVDGEYYFAPGQVLPHRRKVHWNGTVVPRSAMSDALRRSTGSIGTACDVSRHRDEIESLLGNAAPSSVGSAMLAQDVEDPLAFAMEKHLEDFLVENWQQTILGKDWDIFEEDGEPVGQQYATDAGTIDVLAISKDRKRLLVVELKRGRASDTVVGQVLRYIGYVREQIAENEQDVEGAIIALDDDQRMRWALLAVPSVSFYRYQVSFKLTKA
ncbi:MAG: DUF1016 family protein [Planctomycetes bacterium]|nr:DUF1016 family protein [Planctomycetota bacterium]